MKNKGLGLVELLICIAIAALIAGTVWALVPRANEDAKVAGLTADLGAIRNAVTANYRESYVGISPEKLAGVLPASMRRSPASASDTKVDSILVNPWGGSYLIRSVAWGGLADAGYEVEAHFPRRLAGGDCLRLVRQAGEAFQQVRVGEHLVRNGRGDAGWIALEKIEAACGASDSSSAADRQSQAIAWANP